MLGFLSGLLVGFSAGRNETAKQIAEEQRQQRIREHEERVRQYVAASQRKN